MIRSGGVITARLNARAGTDGNDKVGQGLTLPIIELNDVALLVPVYPIHAPLSPRFQP